MPSILVIKPSSLGDITHALQVVESLRRQMPDVKITWVVRDTFAQLVEACETVDEVLVFERKSGLSAFRRLLAEIKSRHFDWVLDMQGLARSGLMAMAADCPRANKLGRSDARELSGFAYGRKVPLPPLIKAPAELEHPAEALDSEGEYHPSGAEQGGANAHAVDILLEFLPALGLEKRIDGELSFKARDVGRSLDRHEGAVVLFPSSRRAEKEWPFFKELASTLVLEDGLNLVWSDSKTIPAPDLPQDHFTDLSGKTSLMDMVELIQRASIVVCNDSGPMHLAAAMGKKIVAVFGPTNPERFGPYPLTAPGHFVLTAPGCDLQQLSVERVASVVRKALVGSQC
ncbi:glycosyltransferase family 9 protein [Rubellicoccus peritrichatus]|uniref:Glycosyltransferase family 9 protein n=1 Tax=Rubellicoccus peritrichatus TaxID=3080537 RepID=A0AAQ3L744_9BACT|nr:glycosyltransferase family 9 protein [Puniceicoccus sp. CR14]WOO40256.1 glycosyltransferase family 9 protein [Puniceicoccus sp. CR14]